MFMAKVCSLAQLSAEAGKMLVVGPYVYIAFVACVALLHSPGISWGGGTICTITTYGL